MRRPYHRPMPKTWWLKHPRYLLFMVREFSALFVVYFALWTVCLLYQAGHGPETLSGFLRAMKAPGWLLWHLIGLAMILLHTYTWFATAPKVIVLRRGAEKVPDGVIVAAQWIGFVIVSLVFLVLLAATT